MEQYVLSFLLKSLVITALVPVVSLLNTLFGKAFPAKLRYAIWLVILVGLIIPLPPAIGHGMITIPLPVPTQTQYTAFEGQGAEVPTAAAESGSLQTIERGSSSVTAPLVTNNALDQFLGGFHFLFIVCFAVWGIVSLAIFVWHISRYISFLRTIRRWGVAVDDENTLSIFRTIQAEMGLGDKNIDLIICGFVSSSMLTGFRRPVILLPEKHFETDELELILKHELIHYKRRDLLVKLLSVIAVSIYWFNPLIYWMSEAMQADGEASCDEAVLLESAKEDRRFYAEVIIGMIGGMNRTGTMLSTCFFYRGKLSIKKRLDAIMDTTLKLRWPAVLVLVSVLILTILSGSVFAFAVQEFSGAMTPLAASELPLSEGEPRIADEAPPPSASTSVSVGGAMEIALARAGGGIVEEIEITRRGNGNLIYDITVRRNNRQYEITVDAATGRITEVDEESTSAALTQAYSTAQVPFEKAMEIAVTAIGGGEVEEIELEFDDGILIYEVKLRYNNREREVKINAITGAIIF